MRKTALLISALAFTSIFGGVVASQARNCTPNGASGATQQRTGTDPFGSCETTSGQVRCQNNDTSTEIGAEGAASLGYLIVDDSKGAQLCSEDSQDMPIAGRITVYKHSGNKLTVGVDGGDSKNSGGASAWDRVDVDADNQSVCVARGAQGTYWQKNGNHSSVGSETGETQQCLPPAV
jgi:hypothetical protein